MLTMYIPNNIIFVMYVGLGMIIIFTKKEAARIHEQNIIIMVLRESLERKDEELSS